MSQHSRLGANSPLMGLPSDIIRRIALALAVMDQGYLFRGEHSYQQNLLIIITYTNALTFFF
jgi:hypothetical protein